MLGGLGGKIGQKQIEQMMKKMNIKEERIDADEVIIKSSSRKIIISNPSVILVKMMGNDVYQITGDVREESALNEDDVNIVMDKTGQDRDTVVSKLKELDNDLARAIMELKQKSKNK